MSAQIRQAGHLVLEVDWARCRAHGHCAELLPEIVSVDQWGYPVIADAEGGSRVPSGSDSAAQMAVSWCPNLALRLERRGN